MEVNQETYSPLIRQYLEIKDEHPDVLILFRVGDFYELFFDDARVASRELDLYLTGKEAGGTDRVPMCGMPFHSVNSYIGRLIAKGYKVGIAEQVEEAAPGKKLIRREIVQLITPGTLIDVGLEEGNNNYIVCVEDAFIEYALSYADISTGDTYIMSVEHDINMLIQELHSLSAKEIVISNDFPSGDIHLMQNQGLLLSYQQEYVRQRIKVKDERGIIAYSRLITYLNANKKRSTEHLKAPELVNPQSYLQMDNFTKSNLELVTSLSSNDSYGSLFWIMNKCKSALGARLLRRYLLRPLNDKEKIIARQNDVAAIIDDFTLRQNLAALLPDIYDLERITSRIALQLSSVRDLLQLKTSIFAAKEIIDHISGSQMKMIKELIPSDFTSLMNLASLFKAALKETPPPTLKEGNIINDGFSKELDRLRLITTDSANFLSELEQQEKDRTGIKNLKIGYNRIFGYYIEVSKGQISEVKEEYGYIRIQTLTNCERYKTDQLQEKEDEILGAKTKIIEFEYNLFVKLREQASKEIVLIQSAANFLATMDVLYSLAVVAINENFIRPEIIDEPLIYIEGGRHPVVAKFVKGAYVENDFLLNPGEKITLITGPNMGGKSTYMRQQALIVVLNQIGSFVPARCARLMIFNKIFTRIGASDDLISGKSTFMMEMLEAANAIRHADERSFILFDEIGRGTSTFDGMALAQAIIEHIAHFNKSVTLFSTHYHQLTAIADALPGIKNIHVQVTHDAQGITFLYKVTNGPSNKSYGINVARLAGLPSSLLNRAAVLLSEFEKDAHVMTTVVVPEAVVTEELPIIKDLRKIEIDQLTPLEALSLLYKLKEKL